ncbi:dentin sialophosphoprotein-like [Lolium rigidum]|uniref:dentin sialophosphoprotein-like n=1 Tax=Lolium rigidum TaxID=89674 RepID=UPI001F5DA2A7|nr:dentin sialophosphoprotein-like [Lolium rigidum]XP_047089141.1 dentin sialophosphoprotein-like [Lolium rigidum]
MAAVMDLDLNCSPPEPEPPVQQDHHRLQRAMLRQEHTFRHQVKDLHRMYWSHNNLPNGRPFWEQQPGNVLYARHSLDGSSHMMDLNESGTHQDVSRRFYELRAENLGVEGSSRRKPDHGGGQVRSGYRPMIDLERLATSEDDDDVEIISSARFSDYTNRKGSTGSSDTPDSHSPVKEKITASGGMLIDLNVAQENDFSGFADPSKVFCSLLSSSSTIQSGECCGNSSKAFHMAGESSVGSSKGSSITVVTSISAPDSARKVIAAGFCDPQSSSQPLHVDASKHVTHFRGNIQHHHTLHEVSGLSSQGNMGFPREAFSVGSGGRNASSDQNRDNQRGFDLNGEMEGFDLNVSVGSIELPSTIASSLSENHLNGDGSEKLASSLYFTENEGQRNVSSVESPTIRDCREADSIDGNSVRSPESGIATNRQISIPETPQGRDYACPRLRPSSNTSPNNLDTTSMHQPGTEEDEKIAATAAETLVSIFTDNSAWITDSRCSNNKTDDREASDEPQVSLDSFEEGVMNLEQMRDDADSIPVRAPDKDGPSCGIKLKRGRGMRDFQREILPGLVSLARHEICDDLHAIGYELRKTRRRNPGDKYAPSTRSRLPRRCSNAWN